MQRTIKAYSERKKIWLFTRRHTSIIRNVQQQTQLLRTYELATDKLTDLKNQRDEIEETIKELQQQIQWGKELISSMGLVERT